MEARRYAGHGGLNLAADVGGDSAAPAVILTHGAGQTRHSWRRAARELVQAGFHVIALDHRGHGDSDWSPDGDYSLDAIAGDVRAVARTLIQPPALVGASLGGAASLIALGETPAGEKPLAASALILVDVVSRMSSNGVSRIRGFMDAAPEGFATLEDAANAIARYLPHRPRPDNLDGLRKNLRQREDGRWYWHWDPAYITSRSQGPASLGDRMEAAAPRVTCPALLVRGARSELVDAEGVRHLLQFLAHAEAVDVGGAHHMVAGDQNDAFNTVIEDFLGRHVRPAFQGA
jgi:pimeloyl-ACP methyl ester carboxylesterase